MEEDREQVVSSPAELRSAEERMLGTELVREMVARRERGEGVKRIARELGVDRKTVKRWLKLGAWQPRQPQRRGGGSRRQNRKFLTLISSISCWPARSTRKPTSTIRCGSPWRAFPTRRPSRTSTSNSSHRLIPSRFSELATGRYIHNGDNLLLLGPPGTDTYYSVFAFGNCSL